MSAAADPATSLQLRRHFAAPRERVFRAWLEREALEQWFRPMGRPVRVSQLDAQVGGSFQFESQAADGTHHLTTGRYLEIRFPERLVFTWVANAPDGHESLVSLEFLERDGGTEVVLTHERFGGDMHIERYQQGWTTVLERLAAAL